MIASPLIRTSDYMAAGTPILMVSTATDSYTTECHDAEEWYDDFYSDSRPHSQPKKPKPPPRTPLMPATWLAPWPTRIVAIDRPQPFVRRKQPRMRGGARKVDSRIRLPRI